METSLHRALKERYGPGSGEGGRLEVALSGFRVDAVGADGVIVEVQSGALGPLRVKLRRLLDENPVLVVKPVVVARRVVRRARPDGADLSARFSPKRGTLIDVFHDLVGVARIFPHPNLRVEVLGVAIDEVRVTRRRRPGYKVVDRTLREVLGSVELREAADLWALLPDGLDAPFTTTDLAGYIGKPVHFAQRVAYCLRLSGAVETVGKTGNRRIYLKPDGRAGVGPGCNDQTRGVEPAGASAQRA